MAPREGDRNPGKRETDGRILPRHTGEYPPGLNLAGFPCSLYLNRDGRVEVALNQGWSTSSSSVRW